MLNVKEHGLKSTQNNTTGFMKKAPLSFFNRPALIVAKELLGCFLATKTADGIERYMITETEAYIGPHDQASHAFKGRTKRTEVMYQASGTIYVYLIYGMYNMLNIVTDEKDYPAAVLIRAVEHNGLPITGPGRVAKHLHIDRMVNAKLLGKEANLWVELPAEPIKRKVIKTPRIGIDYAGPIWSQKQYRFLLTK
ncbi:MAG: putative 3-methyladenine glycosylase [Candidatus Nomurabacteria bacterium]|nr:putative 3-methyladenine glycosylase [Candidatus Nomurabacteria bacterium]